MENKKDEVNEGISNLRKSGMGFILTSIFTIPLNIWITTPLFLFGSLLLFGGVLIK